jgi:hypothetical protein
MPYARSGTQSRYGGQRQKVLRNHIGELRKTYGADFAKGRADNEKIADVLRKMPSLRRVIREREARRFEQI